MHHTSRAPFKHGRISHILSNHQLNQLLVETRTINPSVTFTSGSCFSSLATSQSSHRSPWKCPSRVTSTWNKWNEDLSEPSMISRLSEWLELMAWAWVSATNRRGNSMNTPSELTWRGSLATTMLKSIGRRMFLRRSTRSATISITSHRSTLLEI